MKNPSATSLSNRILKLIASYQIEWSAAGQPGLDEMLSEVMSIVAESLNCDAGSFFLYDQFQHTLTLRATSGLNPGAIRRVVFHADSGITGLAASTRTSVAVEVAHQHPNYLLNPVVGEEGLTSQLSAPIILKRYNQLVGVLNLQTFERRAFNADDIAYVESISDDLATAIQSARLYVRTDTALQRRLNELSLLQAATRELTGTLQPDELMRGITTSASELLEGSAAFLFLAQPERADNRELRLVDVSPEQLETPEEIAEFAYSMLERHFAHSTTVGPSNSITVYGAPLITHGTVNGALCVRISEHVPARHEFLNLLQSFADSAALALENAELFDEARRRVDISQALLQEMHHRVRNNLQIVAALLSMQSNQETEPEVVRPLQDAVARVQSIASVHDLLSNDDVGTTTVQAVASRVAEEVTITAAPPTLTVAFDISAGKTAIHSRQATILALMLNECYTNSIIHGMNGKSTGTIKIDVAQSNGVICLSITDDGIGLPDTFDVNQQSGLGTRIARSLAVSDLGGSFEVSPAEAAGTRVTIEFPVEPPLSPAYLPAR